jgi:hypothetical protein
VAFAILLIAASGRDGRDASANNLRSPADGAPSSVVPNERGGAIDVQGSKKTEHADTGDVKSTYDDDAVAEEELEMQVEVAIEEVDGAEEEEIEVNDSMLVSAAMSAGETAKSYLGTLFGSVGEESTDNEGAKSEDYSRDVELSGEQLDEIVQEISDKLEEEVKSEFRAKADEVRFKCTYFYANTRQLPDCCTLCSFI